MFIKRTPQTLLTAFICRLVRFCATLYKLEVTQIGSKLQVWIEDQQMERKFSPVVTSGYQRTPQSTMIIIPISS